MGLDLALGGLVLITAIRGWLKGFLIQAIRLVGLVASVYAAVPVRGQAKPFVVDHLPSMRPELVDRLLWWASAVVSYFVIVGVASLIVAVSRRQTFGIAEPRRGDQFAGFGLGLIKGLIAAAFLVAGLEKYAQPQIARLGWMEEQRKASTAWQWNEQYHPAARIWSAPPVQQFVGHIQKMGLVSPSGKSEPEAEAEKPVQTASRTPQLSVPSVHREPAPTFQKRPKLERPKLVLRKPFSVPSRPASPSARPPAELDTSGLDPEMLQTIQSIQKQLQSLDEAN